LQKAFKQHLKTVKMEKIEFSYNWNGKLNNKAFTTIRLHNGRKYRAGKTYQIILKGEKIGTAMLKDKRVLLLEQLNEFICYIDTGYSKGETITILTRMYKNVDLSRATFDFCLLVYI
jgi:hypothetical protein